MIGYTLPEIRRLLISLVQACAPDPEDVWRWSRWRRRRQYQARLCHYRHRGYALTLSGRRVASSAVAGAAGLVPGAACASRTSGEPDRGR